MTFADVAANEHIFFGANTHGLSKLASHDAVFDRVPGLTRYAPA
jgi:hypothetical protein